MDEELSNEQLIELERDLRALRRELLAHLDHSDQASKPVDLEQPIGRLSRIDAIQQQKMASASKAATQARIARVAQALSAVEAGRYGECRECEEAIGYRRLKARPESPLCLVCQRAREDS